MAGKRPRPPMKRTTSMMGLSADLGNGNGRHQQRSQPSDRDGALSHQLGELQRLETQTPSWGAEGGMGAGEVGNGGGGRRTRKPRTSPLPEGKGGHGCVLEPVSLEILPVATAAFLWACGLCKRPLGPGRDTFIYRGEVAFCSLECRQQQMAVDERREKCSFASMKDNPSQVTVGSKNSGGCKTAAA